MIVWIIFIAFILLFLALDLGVFNRKAHVISSKEAAVWTSIWFVLAMIFSIIVYWLYKEGGPMPNKGGYTQLEATLNFITGYLIEKSLSIDNIFVIAVIFSSFGIPQKYQHRVLFWGILGAIIFRALMIFFGIALITKFSFTTYVFGGFLLYTAYNMLTSKEERFNPKKSFIYRHLRKIMPITSHIQGEKFFVKMRHLTVATPLFMALVMIEFTDVLFAIDSVPAILAITPDPFLVFTSNIFAILGLRSMYFFLANMLTKFYYLKYSLIAILTFVGIKLMIIHHFKFPEWFSLSFIALSIIVGVYVSFKRAPKELEEFR